MAPYQEVIGHVRAHSLVDGPTPAARLAALADYLDLDWAWLTSRCRGRLEYGYIGPDSLGRIFDQPPYPHLGRAAHTVEPAFL
ncbi:hypothetical protein AB0F03_34195 [Streptomyces sp. NPDC028722]|uniref:hypothetical protein n=1 Tax=Streptomyces sp. NPDC028722 TaxID=3155016 RepID=UPI0033FD8BFE